MAKFEYLDWLLVWILELQNIVFEWDHGNQTKSALKHDVSAEEAEEVFSIGAALPLGVQVRPIPNEPRFAVAGPTAKNRMLTIVFTVRDGRIRPISTRPTHRKEKEVYEKILCQIASRV